MVLVGDDVKFVQVVFEAAADECQDIFLVVDQETLGFDVEFNGGNFLVFDEDLLPGQGYFFAEAFVFLEDENVFGDGVEKVFAELFDFIEIEEVFFEELVYSEDENGVAVFFGGDG